MIKNISKWKKFNNLELEEKILTVVWIVASILCIPFTIIHQDYYFLLVEIIIFVLGPIGMTYIKERTENNIRFSEEYFGNIQRRDPPRDPFTKYISGFIDETGKRYFSPGKYNKFSNHWKFKLHIRRRRRVMLIELDEKKGTRDIWRFLERNKKYFKELREKKNPFKKEIEGAINV